MSCTPHTWFVIVAVHYNAFHSWPQFHFASLFLAEVMCSQHHVEHGIWYSKKLPLKPTSTPEGQDSPLHAMRCSDHNIAFLFRVHPNQAATAEVLSFPSGTQADDPWHRVRCSLNASNDASDRSSISGESSLVWNCGLAAGLSRTTTPFCMFLRGHFRNIRSYITRYPYF